MIRAEAAGTAAVVDVGSNSTRLLLCSGVASDGPRGERFTTITGLRRGAAPDGRIAADALDRLSGCLAQMGARIRRFAPGTICAVATSAVRDAPNRADVEAVVAERIGVVPRVLSGEEEAAAAFAGARLALPGRDPVTIIDIGGGSTEIVRGGAAGVEAAASIDVGVVRCTESHLAGDPPTAEEIAALAAHVDGQIHAAADRARGSQAVIGVAGTFTTLAAIDLGIYDPVRVHGHTLTRERVESIARRLAELPLEARRRVAGLEADRAPVIVAGAVIACRALRAVGADAVVVSERDLLDGVALTMCGALRRVE